LYGRKHGLFSQEFKREAKEREKKMFLATLLAGLVGFLWDKLAFIPWYILIWGQQSSPALLSVGNAKQQMIFDKSVWRD
jgi:hypothetical protein